MATPGTRQRLSDPHLHLLRRFTFGYNTQLETDVLRYADPLAWFEAQLRPGADPDVAAVASWYPHLADAPGTAWDNNRNEKYGAWQYGQDLVKYTLARRILARNQVHETMTDFWSNLFHIPVGEDTNFPWRFDYDKTIRTHALGTFVDLLNAVVVHPAMSGWLTNYRNTAKNINENLGRELLELYTVGRPASYTEDDVKASARLLTGFTVAVFNGYAAAYDPTKHHVGAVTVLGKTFPNAAADGRAELRNYLTWLARHDKTAERIARRLCTRFVSDDPPASVVDAVKATYLSSDTDIKACLRTLVNHPAFKASAGQKARTPVEDMLALARAVNIRPTGGTGDKAWLNSMSWYCSWTGQAVFSWPRPDGTPEKSDTYLSPARLLRAWTVRTWLGNTESTYDQATVPRARQHIPPVKKLELAELVHHQAVMLTGRPATDDVVAAASAIVGFESDKELSTGNLTWVVNLVRNAILTSPEMMLR